MNRKIVVRSFVKHETVMFLDTSTLMQFNKCSGPISGDCQGLYGAVGGQLICLFENGGHMQLLIGSHLYADIGALFACLNKTSSKSTLHLYEHGRLVHVLKQDIAARSAGGEPARKDDFLQFIFEVLSERPVRAIDIGAIQEIVGQRHVSPH